MAYILIGAYVQNPRGKNPFNSSPKSRNSKGEKWKRRRSHWQYTGTPIVDYAKKCRGHPKGKGLPRKGKYLSKLEQKTTKNKKP